MRLVTVSATLAFLIALASGQQRPSTPLVDVPSPAPAKLGVPRIFNDGMVLQRNQPIVIWGWGTPKESIAVTLGSEVARTKVDASGEWSVQLKPRSAGGPFRVTVRATTDSLAISNVLIGDVWVASGQSNMEFQVRQAANASTAIASANDSTIREFKIPNSWSDSPEPDLAGGTWSPADREHVGAFSAVAYFYARHLRPTVNVPIGIVNTTWSGSNIETWMSRRAQKITDSAWSAIQRGEEARDRVLRDSLRQLLGQLPDVDSGLVNGAARWADPAFDDRTWREIQVPGYWEPQGYPGLDGIGWYRTTFTLSPNELRGVSISLSAIDDDDITWVNGAEIGHTTGYNVPRMYQVPPAALHAGPNVLTVRVADGGGGGGINGNATLILSDGTQRPLGGTWKFKVGLVSVREDGQRINKIPTILYNKMVHPILPLAIKGVIWYQGESNSNNDAQAAAYREQFQTLVTSWRHELNGGRRPFPFLWVDLPGYGKPDENPPLHASWATQRESMDAALSLANTGRVVAVDLGDAADLHPKNKEDVGARLALVSRRVAYGESVEASGPTYRAHTVRGDTVVVEFTHAAGGLVTRSGAPLGGFAIAGGDKHFVWANAKVVGSHVYVWSPDVKGPVAVRYAWANNPDRANLYGPGGLPAAPFRTDKW